MKSISAILILFSLLAAVSCGGGGKWAGEPYPATVTSVVYTSDPIHVGNPFVVTMRLEFSKSNQVFVGSQVTWDATSFTVTVSPLFRDSKSSSGGAPPEPLIKGEVLTFSTDGTWTIRVESASGVQTKQITVVPAGSEL
ncbi:MAG: hypothetical protein HRF49_08105 [bacterium]|jgi:hypothetical protein